MKKSKPDYSFKAKAIQSGYCELERKFSLAQYKMYLNKVEEYETGEVDKYINLNDYEAIKNEVNDKVQSIGDEMLFEEAHKINKASYARRDRLSDRIGSMMKQGRCIFLTLTFTDDTLNNTSEETRRKYVTRYLKSVSQYYVANIDYGSKNEREHYHAIVLADKVSRDGWSQYGSIDFERVRQTSDEKQLAKYVCKLVNHAIKETTKRCHTIYGKTL